MVALLTEEAAKASLTRNLGENLGPFIIGYVLSTQEHRWNTQLIRTMIIASSSMLYSSVSSCSSSSGGRHTRHPARRDGSRLSSFVLTTFPSPRDHQADLPRVLPLGPERDYYRLVNQSNQSSPFPPAEAQKLVSWPGSCISSSTASASIASSTISDVRPHQFDRMYSESLQISHGSTCSTMLLGYRYP